MEAILLRVRAIWMFSKNARRIIEKLLLNCFYFYQTYLSNRIHLEKFMIHYEYKIEVIKKSDKVRIKFQNLQFKFES